MNKRHQVLHDGCPSRRRTPQPEIGSHVASLGQAAKPARHAGHQNREREMLSKNRRACKWTTAAAFLAAIAGTAGAAHAEDLQKVSVRMDWVISGYHAAFFVGVGNGYYREEDRKRTGLNSSH